MGRVGTSAARVDQAGEARLASVESLRALAALGVLLGHTWVVATLGDPAATYGSVPRRAMVALGFSVYVFFALSGYLLLRPFVRQHFGGGAPVDVRSYARNRVLRVVPLYYFSIVFLLIVQNHGATPTLWWRHLLGLQMLWSDSIHPVNGPLWSVIVEVQYYAVLPLLAVGLAAVSRGSRRRAAVALGLLGLASLALRIVLVTTADNPFSPWAYQFPTTFFFLVSGMWMALLVDPWRERPPRLLAGPLGSATVWLAGAFALWAISAWRLNLDALCAPASFLLLGPVLLPLRGTRFRRLLAWRPLAALGVATYSLYVWHGPILTALDQGRFGLPTNFVGLAAVVTPLCILAAAVSYRLVEAPFLRLRRRWAETSPARAAALGSRST